MIHVFSIITYQSARQVLKFQVFKNFIKLVQSKVIKWSLKSRGLNKTRVIYDVISLEADFVTQTNYQVEKLITKQVKQVP